MRVIWKGSISFGLVSIPIKLYSAVETKAIKFRFLHKKDNSPIKYKRFCEKENKEVEWEDIVRGLEVGKNKFYTFSDKELEKIKPEKSDNIDVFEFVDANNVDPIYFNNHYYMVPEKKKDRAFFLFRSVLQTTGKVAVARFIMREKEYIATLNSYKNGLLLSTLNYEYEIRDITKLEELKEAPKLRAEEITLAKNLINQLYNEDFEISKYKDTYKEQLEKMLKRKEKGQLVEAPKPKIRKEKKEPDLLATLRASLK